MTDALDRLDEMVSRAAPRPWEVREHDELIAVCSADGWVVTADGDSLQSDRNDAALVASLRNLVPELVAAARLAYVLKRRHLATDPEDGDRYCPMCPPTRCQICSTVRALDAKLAEVLP